MYCARDQYQTVGDELKKFILTYSLSGDKYKGVSPCKLPLNKLHRRCVGDGIDYNNEDFMNAGVRKSDLCSLADYFCISVGISIYL